MYAGYYSTTQLCNAVMHACIYFPSFNALIMQSIQPAISIIDDLMSDSFSNIIDGYLYSNC